MTTEKTEPRINMPELLYEITGMRAAHENVRNLFPVEECTYKFQAEVSLADLAEVCQLHPPTYTLLSDKSTSGLIAFCDWNELEEDLKAFHLKKRSSPPLTLYAKVKIKNPREAAMLQSIKEASERLHEDNR